MIHRKVLEATGCTTARLREIFTEANPGSANGKIRKRFEDLVASRVLVGVEKCAKRASIWQAVDLAWDSTPIQPQTVPLLLWAQRKIKMDSLVKQLEGLDCASEFIKKVDILDKDKKVTGQEIKLDVPRLYEVSINLIRSYVTRRQAAQTARYSNIWPYFRYEPRGTDMVAKLRGDSLSERMDVMVNHYNYRHFFPQTFRHQFLYSRSLVFPRSAWDRVIGWRAKDLNAEAEKVELENYTEREGLDLCAPHPSRYFYDTSAPLPNVNTDTGPSFLSYWDILPFRTIANGDYYNTDKISVGSDLAALIGKYGTFFDYYFDPCVLKWPECKQDPSASNDRLKNCGTYTSAEEDKGILLTQYFQKINPFKEGISKLNVDVWVRLTVAGDGTIVAGEFMTSLPACYGGLNENDDREINTSLAMELMGLQDQLTNLFSQMLMNIRAGMLQIWAIDQDALEPDMREHIKSTLKSENYYSEPQAFFYSGEKLRNLGVQNPADNPKAFLTIIQAQVQTSVNESMQAIAQVLNLADRIVMMSPNETAQPNPREVAAREVTEISTTTSAISTFVSDGIDEQRAAVKRLLYESLICESYEDVKVPVMDRYTAATIKEAGFTFQGEYSDKQIVPLKTPIVGKVENQRYDYYFDSRDGADRPVNSQGAQVMSTLLGQFMQVPLIAQAFGKKRLFEWVNEITRMSGAAIDTKFDMAEGENDSLGDNSDLEKRVAQIEAILKQAAGGAQSAPPPPGAPPAPSGVTGPPAEGEVVAAPPAGFREPE